MKASSPLKMTCVLPFRLKSNCIYTTLKELLSLYLYLYIWILNIVVGRVLNIYVSINCEYPVDTHNSAPFRFSESSWKSKIYKRFHIYMQIPMMMRGIWVCVYVCAPCMTERLRIYICEIWFISRAINDLVCLAYIHNHKTLSFERFMFIFYLTT